MSTNVTLKVQLTQGQFPYPQLVIRTPERTGERELMALAYDYAAKVLRATPERERWVVIPRWEWPRTAVVEIELWGREPGEESIAMKILQQIAG